VAGIGHKKSHGAGAHRGRNSLKQFANDQQAHSKKDEEGTKTPLTPAASQTLEMMVKFIDMKYAPQSLEQY
jgi:hypothetical protein